MTFLLPPKRSFHQSWIFVGVNTKSTFQIVIIFSKVSFYCVWKCSHWTVDKNKIKISHTPVPLNFKFSRDFFFNPVLLHSTFLGITSGCFYQHRLQWISKVPKMHNIKRVAADLIKFQGYITPQEIGSPYMY